MNIKYLEIGSWRVHELWTEEWPAFKAALARSAHRRFDHRWTNFHTELFRQFAYTLGHIAMLWPVFLILWWML